MIYNSEDKLIAITLYKPSVVYRKDLLFKTGKITWHSGSYWEFTGTDPAQGSEPSLTNSNWTKKDSRPIIDTGSISGMIIVLYFKGERKIFAKYSLVSDPDFQAIDDTDSAEGIYKFYLLSSDTVKKKEGVILAEIKLSQGDAGAPAGRLKTIATDIFIAELNSPLTEFIDIP